MRTNHEPAAELRDAFVPLATLERALRDWWLVALLVVAGGLVGWALHRLNPPVYEARAQFAISVDYVSTGPLTQYEEDLAINTTGNLFLASDVLVPTVEQARAEGLAVELDDFSRQILLERKFSVWYARVRHPDPAAAERLAAIWLAQGEAVLLEAYQHALQAYALERYLQAQEGCLAKSAAGAPLAGLDPCPPFAVVQQNLRDAASALYAERQASRGLFPGLVFGPFEPPTMTRGPVTAGRGQFVFLGGVAGLLLALVGLEIRSARRAR